jgi:uncharacterized membrane protein YphA (DoxX/SURF4 family)
MSKNHITIASIFLRLALGFTLLSAVGDRFGIWGKAGEKGVVWGNWSNFIEYTHSLNYYVTKDFSSILGILATVLEIIFGLFLILGFHTKWVAFGTGILTLLFAFSMTLAFSIKSPLDYSVLVDSGASFLLATLTKYPFSVDAFLSKSTNK